MENLTIKVPPASEGYEYTGEFRIPGDSEPWAGTSPSREKSWANYGPTSDAPKSLRRLILRQKKKLSERIEDTREAGRTMPWDLYYELLKFLRSKGN